MKQVGVDICNLPKVDGHRHVIVVIDYFSKWSGVKPSKDKLAPTIAQFLYEVMCRYGYNRDPVLPIDVKHNLDKDESQERRNREGDGDEEQPFDLGFFDAIFSLATKVRTTIADDAADNIKVAQKKQKRDYDSRHMSKTEIKVDDIVLLTGRI